MRAEGSNIVALVTGGYKNIGLEISRKLRSLGYKVIATYRTDEKKALETSKALGIEVHLADMSIEEEVHRLFSLLRSRGLRVGVLVNNVSSFPVGPLVGMDPDDLRGAFESSVYSTFYSTEEAVIDMKAIGWGRIVNIGMAGTTEIKAYKEVAAHASAKTALSVLTLSYAGELEKYAISVNLVSPGFVDKKGWSEEERARSRRGSPSGRLVSPDEIADSVGMMISDPRTTGRIVEII